MTVNIQTRIKTRVCAKVAKENKDRETSKCNLHRQIHKFRFKIFDFFKLIY